MDEHANAILKVGYTAVAALGGSITALAFLRWREMSWGEVALTVFVGWSFAIFVTPWLEQIIFGATDPQRLAGMTYVMASGSNSLLPVAIRRLKGMLGGEGAGS